MDPTPHTASATPSTEITTPRWNGQPGTKRYPAPSWRGRSGPTPDIETRPLGPVLMALTQADLELQELTTLPPTIIDAKYVASYSWLNKKSPTIVVPGAPPAWTPLDSPRKLREDSGKFFRDPNAARFATYPTEPAIQALFKEHPEFQTTDIDIFGCGSTFGNLLRFASGVDKPFRFSVEVIGNTVFFIRKENSPTELIPNVRGYGHTFPENYTTWASDVKGSESHQRLIKYSFGGFDCVVRFECDGYLPDHPDVATRKAAAPVTLDPASLVDSFTTASISPTRSETAAELKVETAGFRMPQTAIFDIKTRSNRHRPEIDMTDVYPRLWVTQTPNFIVGYHHGDGIFRDIRQKDIRRDLAGWEEENANALTRLAALMHKIVDFARTSSHAKFEVYRPVADRLEIREQPDEGRDALPSGLKAKWAQGPKALGRKSVNVANPWEDGEKCAISKSSSDKLANAQPTSEKMTEATWGNADEHEVDYTACSESCGYCGHCTY
ncbi:uncharacterized protein BDZ99DRAFT_438146 [Mytilinidion resinicola]|uniref:Geranylgeranyl pyrophosphate synthetase n=1 Tax=Mytilinidion resinicola TaxID=574789 RepID=A0A6A6YYV7_9PEZI|nr:uncharacterized protein BDZ99DRAFT_438146 [Mytilinidion resinicola]KAF2813184.1 hypothetical protein BDZ99DRAFT_438146 [Mytilinidion resinicola]